MNIVINREKSDELPHSVNVKRVRRIMQILGLKSVIRRKRPDYIKSTPEITAENVLKRDFKATDPFEKWLTDVTEFKYYVGGEVKKLYLSADPSLLNIPRERYHRSTVGYRPSTDAYRGVASAKSGINPHKDTALLYNRS